MTRDEILAMKPGREMDVLVARELFYTLNPNSRWRPSEEISYAWGDVEEEIRERKLSSKYVIALMKVVGVENHSPFNEKELFALIHASPADRCKAALLAVMDNETN